MTHKPFFSTRINAYVPECLQGDDSLTAAHGFDMGGDTDCALCKSPRKRAKYQRDFANRFGTPKQPPHSLTTCGKTMVVR